MASTAYWAHQWGHRLDDHVAPLNRLVDELGEAGGTKPPPYIAPSYLGIRARGLALLRDPGPKAGGVAGSGFLSVENDDPTAERQLNFMVEAGVDPAEVIPWNAYPWYVNAAPTAAQLRAGTEPLRRAIELLPELRVVLLLGGEAQRAWRYFLEQHADLVDERGITALSTYHPGRQALWHKDPAVRTAREQSIRDAFKAAAVLIGESGPASTPTLNLMAIARDVPGRPTGYAGGQNEKLWKATVREAFNNEQLPSHARVQVELDFVLTSDQTGRREPDLDNLIKSTLDALEGVLGVRSGTGMRTEADDVRVDRIVASKRHPRQDEQPGARITVSELPEVPA